MADTLVKQQIVEDVIEGKALLSARESAGLSQRELAARIHEMTAVYVTQVRISRWEGAYEFQVRPEVSAALNAILL